MTFQVLALGGDGIGPEVVDQALKVLNVAATSIGLSVDVSEDLLHGASWERYGTFVRGQVLDKAREVDALLVGAVGGPAWDHIRIDGGPEEQDGLMKLRHELAVYACLRPARAWDALIAQTPFKAKLVKGADLIVMREFCGGAMFSPVRGTETRDDGSSRAFDLNEYSSGEIERFARAGFEVARRRSGRLVSVDKSNIFIAGKLWRKVVEEVGRSEFPDVALTHLFADNAGYQLCCRPQSFDVILADNLFGDLLSDQSAAIAGSLGMLPSASLPGIPRNGRTDGPAIYEPVHGSVPDIADQGRANPIGAILSVAMMFEYSIGAIDCAERIVGAVDAALNDGWATADIGGTSSTHALTDAVIKGFRGR